MFRIAESWTNVTNSRPLPGSPAHPNVMYSHAYSGDHNMSRLLQRLGRPFARA